MLHQYFNFKIFFYFFYFQKFKKCGIIKSVSIAKKKDMKNAGIVVTLFLSFLSRTHFKKRSFVVHISSRNANVSVFISLNVSWLFTVTYESIILIVGISFVCGHCFFCNHRNIHVHVVKNVKWIIVSCRSVLINGLWFCWVLEKSQCWQSH